MYGARETLFLCRRGLHRLSRDGPSETLKRRIAELEKMKMKKKNHKKDDVFVEVPESKSFLDTATMPMILTVVGTALLAKLLMMVLLFLTSNHACFLLASFLLCL